MKITPSTMKRRNIYVADDSKQVPDDWTGCIIGDNINFNSSVLATYFFKNRDDLVYDAFLLMAGVEFCDYCQSRIKQIWGREFHLSIPVDDPDHWQSPEVMTSLTAALNKLTGDHWIIEFRKREFKPNWPQQESLKIHPDVQAVIAFSDGMDSLAVSELVSKEIGDKLVRVRLGKKEHKSNSPFIAVPYTVKMNGNRMESSGRSRGFKFSLLAGCAAHLSDASQIIVPESGQGALGPVLVKLGGMPGDYRNHPTFFAMMRQLWNALFSKEMDFKFPRLWNTKGQTLREYIQVTGDQEQWRQTVSCWRDARQTSVNHIKRQCGICAACLLRRMSIHAAGQTDNCNTYVWDDLSAMDFKQGCAKVIHKNIEETADFKYAAGGVFHLVHMAEFLSSKRSQRSLEYEASEIARALDMSKNEVLINLKQLLEKHTDEWDSFLNSLGKDSFIYKWAKRRDTECQVTH